MRKIAVAGIGFLGCTAVCLAGDGAMTAYFGNTVEITNPGGLDVHVHYKADHTFTQTVNGMAMRGTWKFDGGKLCRTLDNPPPGAPNPLCLPWQAHKVGDKWAVGPNTVTLVAGIH